jgi:hypothetical protein
MAKQKITYLANDGTEFDTEAKALAHDHFKKIEHRIEDFITAHNIAKASAGQLRRLIPLYEVHVAANFTKGEAATTADA